MTRGPNISKILAYVCEKYFTGDIDSIREYNIAVEALGRKPEFDPSSDSIVRVEATRLRRRLREYYENEGATHQLKIQLPETGYIPQFVRPPATQPPAAVESKPSPFLDPRLLLTLLAASLVLCAFLFWRNRQLTANSAPPPGVQRFWSAFLANNRRTSIVTSDANAMILGDILRRPVTLHEYRISSYPRDLLESHIDNPEFLQFASRLMSTFLTNTQDAIVAAEMHQMTSRFGPGANVVFARDYRALPNNNDNVILLGHRKANPSVELFESRMNFYYSWNPDQRKGAILNRKPVAGEQPAYSFELDKVYGTVQFIDGGASLGNVLLLGGSDMAGVQLGGRFLASERLLHKLFELPGLSSASSLPSFEVLLSARRVLNVPYEPEIVAWRVSAN